MASFKESDLYLPVCEYFKSLGYDVQAEVKSCDLVAVNDHETVIAELKTSFCLKLVYQAIERQSLTNLVYIVISRPLKGEKSREWRNMLKLMKRLDIGIITVAMDSELKTVDVVSVPEGHKKVRNSKKIALLNKELNERSLNVNTGGVNKTKILTAYKEKCIFALCITEKSGTITPAELKKALNDPYADKIPRSNYYGWFRKIEKGVYGISDKGMEILNGDDFKNALDFYREKCISI
ncbi:MAG: DUF2161 family putative PD-(D/E)XK-type phosphodiesterase [Candidatus Metalachnospira sp.]|nr:DUF2161 family putative PD-(D/E)XK-type phosphodiesterase [Candidatus Metalachnospira sp.]